MLDVAILGAGIAGLTVAYELRKHFNIAIIEKSTRTGGLIRTVERNGHFFELGPNSVRTRGSGRHVLDLAKEIGLESEIIYPSRDSSKRFVVYGGQLKKVPFCWSAFKDMLPALLKEPFIKKSDLDDETVFDFFSRRFSSRLTDSLIDALITGIYAGDGSLLSMRSCFPNLFQAEKEQRSLLLWMLLKKKEKARHPFFSFKQGMETLTRKLHEEVSENLHLGEEVVQVDYDKAWTITCSSGKTFQAKFLVSSLPMPALKKLITPLEVTLPYAPIVVIPMMAKNLRQGFGYLVPAREKSPLLGVIFNGAIFGEHRASQMTAMLGGARNPHFIEKSDEELIEMTVQEMQKHLGYPIDPEYIFVDRNREAIPQYPVGTWKNLEGLIKAHGAHMAFTGSAFAGVSVGDLVKHAQSLSTFINSRFNKFV